jgi:hypothetical protein
VKGVGSKDSRTAGGGDNDIKHIGNLNLGVHDNSFGGEIPLKPIQKLAGFANL